MQSNPDDGSGAGNGIMGAVRDVVLNWESWKVGMDGIWWVAKWRVAATFTEMSLARFKTAQESEAAGFAVALEELRAGRKRSHWIWYVFPQLQGLGRSSTAQFYGLRGLDEARAYLREAELGARLEVATEAVRQQLGSGARLVDLMGGQTDAWKVVSSLTLFERAAKEENRSELARRCEEVLIAAERQGLSRCGFTLDALKR